MARTALRGMVLIGVIAGCGGGGGGGGGGTVSLNAYPAAYARAVCDQNFKCATVEDRRGLTKQECLDTNTTALGFIVPEVSASQAKGRLAYDGAKMSSCIAGLAAMTCAEWTQGTADLTCQSAFVPKVAIGGACLNAAECIGGGCSGADSSANPPVEGVCKAEIAHGGTCGIDDECVAGDYCDGTCKAKSGAGVTCGSDDECGYSCNENTLKCSTYGGCTLAPVTGGGTVLSLSAMGLALAAARRKRRR